MTQISVPFFEPWLKTSFILPHTCMVQGSARDELSLYAEFRVSNFSFWLLLTLGSPDYLGLFLLVYSNRKMIFLLNFCYICAAMIVLLSGKAAKRNKWMNHSEAILCLSLAPGFTSPLKLACPFKIFRDLGSVFVFVQSL